MIAVRANNSSQPASRWYAGAGIYRHVRLIATDPVHVAQWATFVTTPTVTTGSGDRPRGDHRPNQGTRVAERDRAGGTSTAPNGARSTPVTSAAQNVAAGASVNFTVDVPVVQPAALEPDLAEPATR